MENKISTITPTELRPEVVENHRQIEDREALFRKFGFDIAPEIQFVLDCARPLTGHNLEIGTGKGRFLMSLAREGARVTTVDNDEETMACARLNAEYHGILGRIEWSLHNAEALPWPDHTFDAVVSMNALHHLAQVWAVLAEARRVVKPSGKLVLADFTPEGFDLMERIQKLEGRSHPRGVGNAGEFREWFERHGYRVTAKQTRFIFVLVVQP
jgi:ubiquinone/menaquinone biosynthesis C-methylase UbiE